MSNKFHPAKSSRVLSLGLSTSALFGMVTVFTWNQMAADQQALADQKFAEAIAAAQEKANQVQANNSGTITKQSSVKSSGTTQTAIDQQVTTTPTDVAPAVAPAPQPEQVVVAPAPIVVAPAPAPASNTTTGGSK